MSSIVWGKFNMNAEFRGHKISYRRGYPIIYLPEHHKASKNGMVEIHYIIAEEKLGRPLQYGEEVHHKDENRTNYDMSNLMVFDSKVSHATFHGCVRNGKDYDLSCHNGVWHCENRLPVAIRSQIDPNRWVCPLCGGVMKSRCAKMCMLCSSKKRALNIPSKDQLSYDLEHIPSFCAIGRKYNVSDNAVRRWCRKYGLRDHAL